MALAEMIHVRRKSNTAFIFLGVGFFKLYISGMKIILPVGNSKTLHGSRSLLHSRFFFFSGGVAQGLQP